MKMKNYFFVSIFISILTAVLLFNIWSAISIREYSADRARLKIDYAQANSIAYGLLSVEEWMYHIKKIASDRIENFEFTPAQEDSVKAALTDVMNSLMHNVDSMIQHDHRSLKDILRKFAYNTFVDKKKLHSKIPLFAEGILEAMKKPANRKKINQLVQEKLDEYAVKTYETVNDKATLDTLLAFYHAEDLAQFNMEREKEIQQERDKIDELTEYMLGSLILFLICWILFRNYTFIHKPLFVISVILGLVVLLVGLTTPMIEIDARIKKLDFLLLGEHLQFHDQIIFFRSKSILQVVRILLHTGKPDSMFVGVLLLAFSILFPISKLVSTEIYLLGNEGIRKNKLIYFFAFRSGKWSMADVTVVAIFMAYIGFKGILDSQIKNLNTETVAYSSIATNETSLQPGYILFVGFVLYSLFLSEILKRITPKRIS